MWIHQIHVLFVIVNIHAQQIAIKKTNTAELGAARLAVNKISSGFFAPSFVRAKKSDLRQNFSSHVRLAK